MNISTDDIEMNETVSEHLKTVKTLITYLGVFKSLST